MPRLTLLLFSCTAMSDSLQPHGLQHSRPPCPSPSPEFAQVHAHCTGDAIQPSHPQMPPFPLALNLSQHQWLSQWVGCMHEVTKILELQLQHQSFQRYIQLNVEFQRIARRHKKAFFNKQCIKIKENNRRGKTWDLFRRTGNIKGIFHPKMCTRKDRNSRDLVDTEEI